MSTNGNFSPDRRPPSGRVRSSPVPTPDTLRSGRAARSVRRVTPASSTSIRNSSASSPKPISKRDDEVLTTMSILLRMTLVRAEPHFGKVFYEPATGHRRCRPRAERRASAKKSCRSRQAASWRLARPVSLALDYSGYKASLGLNSSSAVGGRGAVPDGARFQCSSVRLRRAVRAGVLRRDALSTAR